MMRKELKEELNRRYNGALIAFLIIIAIVAFILSLLS
jgi:hypothetical protein